MKSDVLSLTGLRSFHMENAMSEDATEYREYQDRK
jgi:hypothetical protein